MARRKNPPESVRMKCDLANRLKIIRADLYGERGGPELARRLNLPVRTWYNYESGVTIPGEILLKFVELTSVEPMWLLHGQGPRFRTPPPLWGGSNANPTESVEVLLRAALQRLERATHSPPSWSSWPTATETFPQGLARGGRDVESLRAREPLPGLRLEDNLADVDPAAPQPFWVLSSPDDPAHERLTPAHGLRYRVALCEWFNARQSGRWMIVRDDSIEPIAPRGAFVVYSDTPEPLDDLVGKLVAAWRGSVSEAIGWLEPVAQEESPSRTETGESRIRSYRLRLERCSRDRHLKQPPGPGDKRITADSRPDLDPIEQPGIWTVRRVLWVVESSLDHQSDAPPGVP